MSNSLNSILFFLLGASDPEARMVEKLLQEKGISYAWATAEGKPCHPGNAYKADPVTVPEEKKLALPVLFECEPANVGVGDFANFIRIDHHRPGDLGFSMSPSYYWEAASIGQVYHLLGLEATQEAKVMAAFDHCFPAAVRGECPGVSGQEVLDLKADEIAKGTKTDKEAVLARIEFFGGVLETSPTVQIGECALIDLRDHYLGEGYALDLLTAQVAVTKAGEVALLRHRDRAGAPEKWSITGNALPETVVAFQKEWAPGQGLEGIYGVPARGFAGGYLPAAE